MQGELPFLVVHGDGVWTVVYALLIAGTARLCVALRAMLQRRRARSEVHARQQMKTEGDVVALRAKVVVGEAATLSQEGFVATERSKELCIEHEGERIRIVGDVFVEHGAHERTGYFRIPRGATASMSEGAKPWSATILRKVGVNDDVIVTGTRGVVASGEPPEGYREPGSRSAIIAGDKHVVISAIRPAGRPPAWGLAWTGPLLGFAFAWLLLLRWVGMTALEHVGGEDHLESPLGNLSPVAIAAATPTTRNEALSHLESATYDPRTEASLRLAIGFAELQGRCPAHLLQKRGMFEEALAAAKRCGPSPTATQLVYLGRYAEAAATLPKTDRSYIAVASAVATGRWHDAAVDIEANEDLRSRCLGAMFRASLVKPIRSRTSRCGSQMRNAK